MKRKDYRGHPRQTIDAWFLPEEDLSRYDSKLFYFDPPSAERVLKFFKTYCTHVEGEWAGKPLMPEQWQYRILRDLFGWKRLIDGTRKHRVAWIEVPRKNGKSTLGAGVGLYLTMADREPGAKVFCAATEKEQAGIIFEIAKEMIKASPELTSRLEVFKRSMYMPGAGSVLRVLSGAPKKSGLNAHGIIFDEVHEQPDRKLWDILHTSTVSRRQPVTWAATTAGIDEESICKELHDRAVLVAKGTIDDISLLPVIYAADKNDDWARKETWEKANPNIGISVKVEYLESECKNAQDVPAYQNTFKRFHLNMWTSQREVWMPQDKWEACGEPFDAAALREQRCFGGVDLATVEDLATMALVWPVHDGETGIFHFFSRHWFWLPRENLRKKIDADGVPYDLWAEQGFLTLTEGDIIDYDEIRAEVNRQGEIYPIAEIAIDRWNATQITTQLAGDGFTVVPFGQGFASMAGPTKQLMDTVKARTLHHGGNPIMNWMASNVSVRTDPAGNWKPDKAATKKRIDGIVALIMALGRSSVHLDGGESVYSSRGVLVL